MAGGGKSSVRLDTPRVRVLELMLGPGQSEPMHSHPDYLVLVLSPATMRMTSPDGEARVVELTAGEVSYNSATSHAGENIGSTQLHEVIIELKDSPGPAETAARQGEYEISSDRRRLDIDAIHQFLKGTYWSPGIPRDIVERSIRASLCFGLYQRGQQVGFARVVTDAATFAYVCDVYVLEEHRGRGLARWLMEQVMSHPDLRGLRRIVLVTRDAHRLYEKAGFQRLASPERYMEVQK